MDPNEELKKVVAEYLSYLDAVDYSHDSEHLFHPVSIGCCRAKMVPKINATLNKMQELSGYKFTYRGKDLSQFS